MNGVGVGLGGGVTIGIGVGAAFLYSVAALTYAITEVKPMGKAADIDINELGGAKNIVSDVVSISNTKVAIAN